MIYNYCETTHLREQQPLSGSAALRIVSHFPLSSVRVSTVSHLRFLRVAGAFFGLVSMLTLLKSSWKGNSTVQDVSFGILSLRYHQILVFKPLGALLGDPYYYYYFYYVLLLLLLSLVLLL